MIDLYIFMSGGVMFGAWIGGFFFYRFWKRTSDRLFWWFAVSFWLMSVERGVLLLFATPFTEDHSLVYAIRLVAFSLLIVAIVGKNRVVQNFPKKD